MVSKIAVTEVYKAFGEHQILSGVSFKANKGAVVALLGASGSGKSTLLRCINLLTPPDAGVIQIDEQQFIFAPQHKSTVSQKQIIQLRIRIGMVFQQFNLWPHKTVLGNLIEAPIHVLKQPKAHAIEQAHTLLTKVGLSNKLTQYPSQLSGGQQQRAAIARALMMQPEVMLFDEPTSSLDPEMVGEVLNVMQALAADGMTMIVATHELGFARNVATDVIFLEQGRILEQGKAPDLFNNPQTDRFQRFLKAVQHA